jgi:hypothetical protein
MTNYTEKQVEEIQDAMFNGALSIPTMTAEQKNVYAAFLQDYIARLRKDVAWSELNIRNGYAVEAYRTAVVETQEKIEEAKNTISELIGYNPFVNS